MERKKSLRRNDLFYRLVRPIYEYVTQMFQTAIGRLQGIIESPPRSLDLWVFLDAGGKAGDQRVWGGLAAIGESELSWIEKVLDDMRKNGSEAIELKGRELETSIIKATGRRILQEDRRIIFWANWLLDWKDLKSEEFSKRLGSALNSLKPNPHHIEQHTIEAWQNNNANYFETLKPINRHKLLSIIIHVQWLIAEIKRIQLGAQLKSARIVIDQENFPDEAQCGVVVKSFIAAGLQSAGMDFSLTGKAFREEAREGSVSVNVAAKSGENTGVQFVDILLQAVLRKVMPIE
jgi:hypothetical protein